MNKQEIQSRVKLLRKNTGKKLAKTLMLLERKLFGS